jgi:hypothetical protein
MVQETNYIGYVLTGISLLLLGLQVYIAFFRGKAQNLSDGSTAALNYQKMVIELQGEIKHNQEEVKELRGILENSHLEVKLEITMGEAPIVKEWKWTPREEPQLTR